MVLNTAIDVSLTIKPYPLCTAKATLAVIVIDR